MHLTDALVFGQALTYIRIEGTNHRPMATFLVMKSSVLSAQLEKQSRISESVMRLFQLSIQLVVRSFFLDTPRRLNQLR